MIYLHKAFDGNSSALSLLTSELPEDVFAEMGGAGSNTRNPHRRGKDPKSKTINTGKKDGRSKPGRSFIPQDVASAMSERHKSETVKNLQETFNLAQRHFTDSAKDHDGYYKQFVDHCEGDRKTANNRIKAVKIMMKNKSTEGFGSFGYESDASETSNLADSQEVTIMSILRAHKSMKEAKANADSAKARLSGKDDN